MELHLIRHGQSLLNKERRHQHRDTPLSEKGKQQAALVGFRLREYGVSRLISSPYLRTQETAHIIASHVGKEIELMEELREIKRPSVIEGKVHDDPAVLAITRQIMKNFHNPDWRHSDEDTFEDLKQRVFQCVCLFETMQDPSVVAVTHGGFIRMFVALAQKGKALTSQEFIGTYAFDPIENTSITTCEFHDSRWNVIAYNDTSHIVK